MLTNEGRALLPVMSDALDRIGARLDRIEGGGPREILNSGVIGTFAADWLLDRLADPILRAPLPPALHLRNRGAPARSGRSGGRNFAALLCRNQSCHFNWAPAFVGTRCV